MLLDEKLRSTKKSFFGQQRPIDLKTEEWYLEKLTGKKGSVLGLPLGGVFNFPPYGSRRPLKYWVDYAKQAHDLGCIIECDWHPKHPVYDEPVILANGRKLESYRRDPNNPNKNIKSCLGSPEFYKQLDFVAEFFLALESLGIEYIFRPFHEMNLDAFWWGAIGKSVFNTPENYTLLFRTIADHLRQKGADPIIAFAPNYRGVNTQSHYELLYPGDDYVDIVGFDWYHPDPKSGILNASFLKEFAASRGKILALTEIGCGLGGFKRLSIKSRTEYFDSLIQFVNALNPAYVRFWTEDFLPYQDPELKDFVKNFIPSVRMLGE